jgi:hypothetical protein
MGIWKLGLERDRPATPVAIWVQSLELRVPASAPEGERPVPILPVVKVVPEFADMAFGPTERCIRHFHLKLVLNVKAAQMPLEGEKRQLPSRISDTVGAGQVDGIAQVM